MHSFVKIIMLLTFWLKGEKKIHKNTVTGLKPSRLNRICISQYTNFIPASIYWLNLQAHLGPSRFNIHLHIQTLYLAGKNTVRPFKSQHI